MKKLLQPTEENINISTRTILRFWLTLLAIVAAVAAIVWARPALILILIAFILAVIFNRPVSWLAKRSKSRSLATILVLLLICLTIALVLWAIIPLFTTQINEFLSSLPQTIDALKGSNEWLHQLATENNFEAQYFQLVSGLESFSGHLTNNLASGTVTLFGSLLNTLVSGTLTLFLTAFMLIEGPTWLRRFWRWAYSDQKIRSEHRRIADQMYDVVSGYANGMLLVALCSAFFTGLGLFLVGLFLPIPRMIILPAMALLCVCVFIPMFGASIGGGVICLLLLFYSWPAAAIFLLYYIVYQQIENNLIIPKIFSRQVNLSPLTVLVAVVIGTYAAGFLGILVAVPLAGCLQILLLEGLKKHRSATVK